MPRISPIMDLRRVVKSDCPNGEKEKRIIEKGWPKEAKNNLSPGCSLALGCNFYTMVPLLVDKQFNLLS